LWDILDFVEKNEKEKEDDLKTTPTGTEDIKNDENVYDWQATFLHYISRKEDGPLNISHSREILFR